MFRLCSTSISQRIAPVRMAAALMFLLATSAPALGQFAAVAEVRMINVDENQLEQIVFSNQHGQSGRGRAQRSLESQVALVERIGNLSDEQKTKLELAGLGDIHRFFSLFETLRRNTPTGQVTMDQYQKMWQEAQPLQRRYQAGLHGRGSLFQKTLWNTLDKSQLSTFQKIDAERRRREYGAIVRATVAQIDRAVPLTADQRARLIDLVLTRTEPPEIWGQSYYQYHVVLLNMSKLPEEELKPIFLGNEWKVVEAMLRQGQFVEAQLREAQEFDDE
jgi:hypothetical protein